MLRASSLTNAAITGGTVTGTNAPYVIARNAIPFIKLSTGSIGNNGALTAITALPTTYANAYVWVPAGGIAAGVPAAATWYFAQFSSTTAATIFNNIYTTGIPTIPTSPTAFATTGPGAFTGDTGAVTGPQYTMAGGSMGPSGVFHWDEKWTMTSNANAKTKLLKFNSTSVSIAVSLASNLNLVDLGVIQNRGAQASQVGSIQNSGFTGTGGSGSGLTYTSVDTSANVTVARVMTGSGAATDNIVFEAFTDTVAFSA